MKKLLLLALPGSLAALVAVACSSGSPGSGGGSGGGGGCGAYFDSYTAYAKQCGGQGFLNDRDRWLAYCQLLIGAPGSSGADSALSQCATDINSAASTCASATKSTACATFMGSLANGSACGSSVQCATGNCKGSGEVTSDTGITTVTCGVCADKIAVGQPCDSTGSGQCVTGADCSASGTNGSPSKCVATIVNDIGGACGGSDNATCKDSLRCDFTTSKCAALATAGAACSFNGDCASPLICGSDMKCAQPKADGAPCTNANGSAGCARNEICNAMSNTCTAPTLVDPGGTCDYAGRSCKVGGCNVVAGDGGLTAASTGTCPMIIPDGQPCGANMKDVTCNEFAACINGKCGFFDPSSCK